MNWDRLACVTPPAEAVLSTDEIKSHLKLFGAEESDEDLDDLGASAEALFNGPRGIGLALITQTWRLSLDRWPGCEGVYVPLGPVQSIEAITYSDLAGDTQTLDPALYAYDLDADPVVIQRAFGAAWPDVLPGPGAVKVTFKAGFGDEGSDVPADIRRALKLLVGHFHRNREAVVGIETKDQPAALPLGVQAILDRYGAHHLS